MIPIFFRGLQLNIPKEELPQGEIEQIAQKLTLTVPMSGADAGIFRLVEKGTQVAKYQALSAPQNQVPTFSPVSGVVKELEYQPHSLLGKVMCAVVEPDGGKRAVRLPQEMDMPGEDEILKIALESGILDEYDGSSLYRKLRRFRRQGIDLLVMNCLDDEPFINCSVAVLKEDVETAQVGLALAAKACGINTIRMATVREKGLEDLTGIGGKKLMPMLIQVPKNYPAWKNMKEQLLKEGKNPERIGVQACVALGNAIQKGFPQTTVVITVAGDAVHAPRNLRVCVGTPVSALLKHCEVEDGAKVIMGSPFSGVLVEDWNMPVCLGIRGLTAMKELPKRKVYPCIGCGKCEQFCPENIKPWYINRQLKQETFPEQNKLLKVEHCTGCGVCATVCPCGLNLPQIVQRAMELKETGGIS